MGLEWEVEADFELFSYTRIAPNPWAMVVEREVEADFELLSQTRVGNNLTFPRKPWNRAPVDALNPWTVKVRVMWAMVPEREVDAALFQLFFLYLDRL